MYNDVNTYLLFICNAYYSIFYTFYNYYYYYYEIIYYMKFSKSYDIHEFITYQLLELRTHNSEFY